MTKRNKVRVRVHVGAAVNIQLHRQMKWIGLGADTPPLKLP